jgi:hypothetical protein
MEVMNKALRARYLEMVCKKCGRPLCEGDCMALIDGVGFSQRELVVMWRIQARQVREHLEKGTHPRCADGSIVRRASDGKRLRPCARRGGMLLRIYHHRIAGRPHFVHSVSQAAKALRVPKVSLHRLIKDPGRPLPAEWPCEALRSEVGWHFKAY